MNAVRVRAAVAGVAVVASVAAGAVAGALVPPGASVAGAAPAGRCAGSLTISVQGTGTASGAPNLLTITLDLSSSASSAVAALTANNTATAAVVGALKQGGVATKDLQTTDLSVQPQYGQTGTVITGYEVDDTVVAKLRNLATAGSVIDAAVGAGGNAVRVDDLEYSVTNPTSLQDSARSMAVHQAAGHAKAIASAAGERLGKICSLTDETSTPVTTGHRYPILPESASAGATSTTIVPATVPVQQGTETETDQVKIVYALVPAPARR